MRHLACASRGCTVPNRTQRPFSEIAKFLKAPLRRRREAREARLKALERGAHKALLEPEAGAAMLADAIRTGEPFAAGKIGRDELRALNFWQDLRPSERRWRKMRVKTMIHRGVIPVTTSGIYPIEDSTMSRFCEIYAESIGEIDALGVWFNVGEKRAVDKFARPRVLMRTDALRSHLLATPWSHAFEGKTVMVVTPFPKTIERQFSRREKVWRAKSGLLPDFELVTLRTQQNAGILDELEYPSWLEGLETLKERMAATRSDVVLVGAGAWSLPLVAHAKRLGRFGAHLGGDLQLLFGVTGGRWQDDPVVAALANDAWTRVLPDEIQNEAKVRAIRSASNYW